MQGRAEDLHGSAAGPVQRAGRTQVRAGGPARRVPVVPSRRVRWKEPPTRAAWHDFIRLGCRTKLPPCGALSAGADQAEVHVIAFSGVELVVAAPNDSRRDAGRLLRIVGSACLAFVGPRCRQLHVRSGTFPPLSSPSPTMQDASHGQAGNALVYKPASDLIWLHDPAARSGFQRACRARRPPRTANMIGSAGRRCGGVRPLIVLWRQRPPCLFRAPPMGRHGQGTLRASSSRRRRHPTGRLRSENDGRSRSRARLRMGGPCSRPYPLAQIERRNAWTRRRPFFLPSPLSVVVMGSVAAASTPPSDKFRAVARGNLQPSTRHCVGFLSRNRGDNGRGGRSSRSCVRSFDERRDRYYPPPPMPDDNANPFHAPELASTKPGTHACP
jgi:hypothetical protein